MISLCEKIYTNEAGCHFCGAHLTRESWNRRNTIYNIFHQNTALRLLFCVVVYLYEFQMSIVKHFSMDSVKFELGIKRALYFNDFLWKVNILNIDETCRNEYPPPFPNLKHLQAIYPSFEIITIPWSNSRETFSERLEWMCKLFKINCQKYFKTLSFSRSPPNILLKNLQWETRSNSV